MGIVLVKISKGLYRTRGGSARVTDDLIGSRVLGGRGIEERWGVYWKDWMSAEHVRRFPTLREARAWLKEN